MAKARSVIQNRRSIRRYHDVEVSPTVIHHIIEASSWAPSAHNAQPWRFVVVKNKMKLKLAKAMAIPYEQDLIQDGKNPDEIKTLIQLSINRFSTTPVLNSNLYISINLRPLWMLDNPPRALSFVLPQNLSLVTFLARKVQNALVNRSNPPVESLRIRFLYFPPEESR